VSEDFAAMPADLRPLLRKARAAGWTVTATRGTLVEWCPPGSDMPALTTNTKSQPAFARANLRRHGLDV